METAGKYFDILDAEALASENLAPVDGSDLGTGGNE
jgi:hypothetical protein